MGRLDGQVAIVTGGAQGIGDRAPVHGGWRRRGPGCWSPTLTMETAEANAASIREAGGVAESFRADLFSHHDIKAMVDKASSMWGRLDILVNNGYTPTHGTQLRGALEVTEDEWDAGMSILVKSIFLGVKYAVPEMRKTGAGSIINMASVQSLLMAPGKLVYQAGKSAVIGVTRQMATDFGPMGIRVNAICPGHIATERIQAAAQDNPSGARFLADQYLLRRGRTAGGRGQLRRVSVFRRSLVHHRPRARRRRRTDGAASRGLRRPAGPVHPGQPGHHPPIATL